MNSDIVKRLRERPMRGGGESNDDFARRRQKEREDGADLIKAQTARIAELEAALKAAAEDIGDWGAYASQYFQEKWDLAGEVKRYTAIAEGKLPYRARSSMGEQENE